MNFLAWTAAAGCLLLFISLTSGWINRSLVPLFGIYLLVGIVCGPSMFALLHIDILAHASLTERITEVAIAVSLFLSGLKIRLPMTANAWRTGIRLAGPAMILTVVGIMFAAHAIMGLNWPLSLAFAAMIAPTDPVLASLITVKDARDDDSLRLALSSEAGFNDGTALSLLMLAILLNNPASPATFYELAHWLTVDVIWALLAGLAIGYGLGRLIGHVAAHFRHAQRDVAPCDFLAISLICLSYTLALALDASGFLAAFAAGVGMRSAEFKIQQSYTLNDRNEGSIAPPAEMLVNPHHRHSIEEKGPVKFMGLVIGDALTFGDTAERLLAGALVIILGITLTQHWEVSGLLMAIIIFCLIRPLSVYLATWRSSCSRRQRLLIGWLGIRGTGSINCIAYACTHGLTGPEANVMIDNVITIVAVSVLVHGITVTPLLDLRQNYLKSREKQHK